MRGIICITDKIDVIVNKQKSAININISSQKQMVLKIGYCRTPKIVFRKSLNSEPALDFSFFLIEIGRNKGQWFFIETKSI